MKKWSDSVLFQEVLAAVSTSAMTPVLRVVFREGTNTLNFHKWNVCCWDGTKNCTGGARELKWNGYRFFIIIVGNITPPPRGHGARVGSKRMAKGRKERQKEMKLEEEYRKRNEELRLELKAEWMEQKMPEKDKAEEAPPSHLQLTHISGYFHYFSVFWQHLASAAEIRAVVCQAWTKTFLFISWKSKQTKGKIEQGTTPVLPGLTRSFKSDRTHPNTTLVIPGGHRQHFFFPLHQELALSSGF